MQVTHPAKGVDIAGMRVLLAGKDSARYKSAINKTANERARKGNKLTAEMIESANISIAAACVIDWQGLEENGEALPCKPAVIEQVLKKYKWLFEQIDKFVDDRANFFADDEAEGDEKKSLNGSPGASA